LTCVSHATDRVVILGLMGETSRGVDPESVEDKLAEAEMDGILRLLGEKEVPTVLIGQGYPYRSSRRYCPAA